MKFIVEHTYVCKMTGKDGRTPLTHTYTFQGQFAGQTIPRIKEEFYFQFRPDGEHDQWLRVESVQHRLRDGVSHVIVLLETDESVDPGGKDWTMERDDQWVQKTLKPGLKRQGFNLVFASTPV